MKCLKSEMRLGGDLKVSSDIELNKYFYLELWTSVSNIKPMSGNTFETYIKKRNDFYKIQNGQHMPDFICTRGSFHECKVKQVTNIEDLENNLKKWWNVYTTTQTDQSLQCQHLACHGVMVFHILFYEKNKAQYVTGQLRKRFKRKND